MSHRKDHDAEHLIKVVLDLILCRLFPHTYRRRGRH